MSDEHEPIQHWLDGFGEPPHSGGRPVYVIGDDGMTIPPAPAEFKGAAERWYWSNAEQVQFSAGFCFGRGSWIWDYERFVASYLDGESQIAVKVSIGWLTLNFYAEGPARPRKGWLNRFFSCTEGSNLRD